MKFWYSFKSCQSGNARGMFCACICTSTQTQTLALMSQTHPVRLVRRGWRGLAGVRSTWPPPPPPLTARCWRSQISSVLSVLLANAPAGCFLYGTDPSTAPHFPQDRSKPCCSDSRCLPKSVRNKTTKKQHAYELNRRQEVNEVWDLNKLLGEQSDCCLFQ